MNDKTFTIAEINSFLKGDVEGYYSGKLTGPENIDSALTSQITFIRDKKFEKKWHTSKASVAIVNKNVSIEPGEKRAFIKVDNVDLAMSQILSIYALPLAEVKNEQHVTAIVDPSAIIGKGVKIGAGCFVGPRTIIGDYTILYPNVTILDDCEIGNNNVFWSGSVIRERTVIGSNCIFHPNATIGADGFGYRPCPEVGLVKIPHIGNVMIGDWVEIGANSCVDRGKFSSTVIGTGCKIDNLVQIGHNSVLGNFCIMAGNSGLAGSVKLGNGVVIGGSASIKDHTVIGDGAVIGAGSGVTGDVAAGVTMLGYPALVAKDTLKQWAFVKRITKERSSI
ncbi:UDP-3-O-(3-hydroxymyristoyl)glucosamine N-acyltransferase [Flavobacterium sp. I3-2]|uniref:UDP-3-O-(3-hydroxymyristoyl)glucosamine N-acyltransferase n=1 Tax=Flavobacterium sp. I3-2 TaxID=2748319 RepID=UPI0015A896F0|nr:UDP-3-O-(3-hydroxymyristoyl)glucosamine N-acyltransferase [Flavobacterium sp. I3-2]